MRTCCRGTESVSVYQTLKSVCKKNVRRSSDTDIRSNRCTSNADAVRKDDVFFALDTDDLDEAVGVAVHNGCIAVVTQMEITERDDVPVFVVPNVAECYAAFCQALYDNPAKSLKMIGITGTSGKTSVSYLVSSILHEAGYQVGLIGSLGIFDGKEYHRVCGHDLLPNEIAAWLYRMMMNGCTHVVVEASSRCIASGVLGGIKFDAVCLTNIRKDHLDYHQSVEEYRRCKLDIFKYAKKNALAVFNADDKISEAVMPFIDYPILTAGIHNTSADINGVLVDRTINEQTFYITAGMETAAVQTTIIGDEHVYNCLSAATLCLGFGVDIRCVARGIEEIKTIPGRMERIDCGEDFCVFVDSARTPDSLSSVLRTLRDVTPKRLLCVFGATESTETTKHKAFAKALENYCDCVILTSAADEYNEDTTDAICNLGGQFSDPFKATVISHRSDAISWSLTDAESGDTILIIGNNIDAGTLRVHHQETEYETVGLTVPG